MQFLGNAHRRAHPIPLLAVSAVILRDRELREHLDLREPVAVMLTVVLHFIPDEDSPNRLVNVLKAAMAPGSFLVVSHATADDLSPDAMKQVEELYVQATAPAVPRSRAEIARKKL